MKHLKNKRALLTLTVAAVLTITVWAGRARSQTPAPKAVPTVSLKKSLGPVFKPLPLAPHGPTPIIALPLAPRGTPQFTPPLPPRIVPSPRTSPWARPTARAHASAPTR